MAQQQTVLRVLTNIPNPDVIIDNGTISITSQINITLVGNGTSSIPYSGSSGSGAEIIMKVNQTNGTLYYNISTLSGYTQTLFITDKGLETVVQQTTGTNRNLIGNINVNVNDTIRFDLQNILTIQSIYFVPTPTPTFKNDYLDLYGSIPIKINRSYADLQDISKRNSDFSINIQLPGTKKNNRFFESFFDVDAQSLYFNATKKTLCDVLINDQSYFHGYLRLNKISVINTKVEYDVSLFSTVGNLFGSIGNNLLKDLNFNDPEYTFNHTFNPNVITDSLITGAANFSINGEQPKPYFYPIVHNGYLYSGDTVNFTGGTIDDQTSLYTSSGPIGSFANNSAFFTAGGKPYRINTPNEGLIDNQLKPALSVWNILKLLFKTYGYNIKSDFFNTPWMKTLYMYGYFSSDGTKFSYKVQPPEILPASGVDIIWKDELTSTEIIDCFGTQYDNNTNTITAYVVKKGTGIPCYCAQDLNIVYNFQQLIDAYPYPTTDYTKTMVIPAGTSGNTLNYLQSDFTGCNYYIYNNNLGYNNLLSDVSSSSLPLSYLPAPSNSIVLIKDGELVNFSLIIDPFIKQIDILSSVAKKFNLVLIPNPLVSNEIKIEPFEYYVGTGNIWDWTDKISFDQGFTVQPALNFIESNLILTDLEDGDYGNKQFKDRNNRIYGQNNVYNPTDFKSQEKKIETTFSPEVLRQWDTPDQLNTGNIKLPLGINYAGSSNTSSSGNSQVVNYTYTGLKTKPKLFWYLGNESVFFDTLGEVYNATYSGKTFNIYIGNSTDGTSTSGVPNAPIVSHTMPIGMSDANKINNDSLSLLFNSEQPTDIGINTYNVYTDNDAYSTFYASRVNNLYDANTRFLSGKFYLKLNDYSLLKANDIIRIKDKYFIWNKINGYNLTTIEMTDVELVQFNNEVSTYPTRYFAYYYCDDLTITYKLKTDFTNPNLLDTNFGWSIYYDHNVGIIGGIISGFTSTFKDDRSGGPFYVPYTIFEITENQYNTSGYIDWKLDTMSQHLWYANPDNPFGLAMPTYWLNSTSTTEGLNLWDTCSGFTHSKDTYDILTEDSKHYKGTPTPTPTPTNTPTPTPTATSTPTPTPTSTPTPTPTLGCTVPSVCMTITVTGATQPEGPFASMNYNDCNGNLIGDIYTINGVYHRCVQYVDGLPQIFSYTGIEEPTILAGYGCNGTGTPCPTSGYDPLPTVTPTPTPTSTPTPTPGPTDTPTPTPTPTVDYDYYLAEEYDCSDCSLVVPETTVAFPAGTSVTIGKYYGRFDSEPYSYRITDVTTPSIAAILKTPQYNTCGQACLYPTPTPTPTSTATPTPTPTPIFYSKEMCSGLTLNDACSCDNVITVYYQGSLGVGTDLYTDLGITAVPTPGYYNDTFVGQVYHVGLPSVQDGRVTEIVYCPTPTPTPTPPPADPYVNVYDRCDTTPDYYYTTGPVDTARAEDLSAHCYSIVESGILLSVAILSYSPLTDGTSFLSSSTCPCV